MDFNKLKKRRDALNLLYSRWQPSPKFTARNLHDAEGYVLAENLHAVHNLPVVRASGMDGIAVNFDLFEKGMPPDTTKWRAGREYVRADTGDDFDDAYDTVIPIEQVIINDDGGIQLSKDLMLKRGMHVNGRGSRLKEGDPLAVKGTLLAARQLAVLAMGGITEVSVIEKPKVGFIPTGSELIPAGTPLARGQNIDSNSILAQFMLAEMGAEPMCYPIVKDKKEDLESVLDQALEECDFVIMNAGSSKGEEDLNTELLASKGELLCHGVAAVPGRPMGIAVISEKAVINLAGPMIAAFYGFDWIIRDMVCKWIGRPVPVRKTVEAVLTEDFSTPPPLERLAFMEVKKDKNQYTVRPYNRKADARLPSMMANGLFITKLGERGYKKGDPISVELLE